MPCRHLLLKAVLSPGGHQRWIAHGPLEKLGGCFGALGALQQFLDAHSFSGACGRSRHGLRRMLGAARRRLSAGGGRNCCAFGRPTSDGVFEACALDVVVAEAKQVVGAGPQHRQVEEFACERTGDQAGRSDPP